MKLLCPGAYTWNNKGDAALVIAMLAELRRVYPGAQVTVLSDTPRLDAGKYDAAVLPPVLGGTLEYEPARRGPFWQAFDRHLAWRTPVLARAIDGLARLTERGLRALRDAARPPQHFRARLAFYAFLSYARLAIWIFGRACHIVFPAERARVVRAFCEADAVVMVPGGYMIAPHSRHTHWLRHAAAILIARWLGKPTFLYACTLGPFHGVHNRWLAGAVLSGVDAIVLRESTSEKAASRIAPKVARILTTDVAFLLPSCPLHRTQALRHTWLDGVSGPIVGISVRDYGFPGHPDARGQKERYLNAIATAAQHLVTMHGASVFFVPQVLADETNDLDVARAVDQRISNRSSIHIVDADLSPIDLRGLYSCFDAFVGVRMHANIFALSELVPTVAIAYEPKTAGIMSFLGLDNYVLDIRTIDTSALLEKVDRMMANRIALREQLAQSTAMARSFAARSADYISERLHDRGIFVSSATRESK